MIREKLAGYNGFAVEYDENRNPYFKSIMVENLALLGGKALGRKLLKLIGDGNAKARADFPPGVNVICVPHHGTFVQSGHKMTWAPGSKSVEKDTIVASAHASHNPTIASVDPLKAPRSCPFYILGGSFNCAVDPTYNADQGTVCHMHFTNTQVITSKGEISYPHIVLAHELIHSYHCIYGIHKGDKEEQWTTGIGEFAGEEMSENGFRKAFGMDPRKDY